MTMLHEERFQRGADGRMYDTQMHPKIKAAQDAADRRRGKKASPVKGFSQPSQQELEDSK